MSFLRNFLLFTLLIVAVICLISILVCCILDKPLHMKSINMRLEALEKKYGITKSE